LAPPADSFVGLNLGLNSRDAMPQGGRIGIKGDDVMVDEPMSHLHPGARPGPHVRLAVSDNGSGIPPALLKKIFAPFFTTESLGRGTGLGLSTAAGIVKSHGGFLKVESAVGKGTEFDLYCPALLQASGSTTRTANPFAGRGATAKAFWWSAERWPRWVSSRSAL